jgi:hypothetical protein
MNFYKLWKLVKEDGDLNGYCVSMDDDPNNRQQYMKNDDIRFNKTLNLKRKLRKLNYCRR